MAPLRYAAKFDPVLSLDCAPHALHPGTIQGKEGIKFCHLATIVCGSIICRLGGSFKAQNSKDRFYIIETDHILSTRPYL